MKNMPFFRWVASLGLILIGCAVGVYWVAAEPDSMKQVDLTVIHEQPDGTCTVRWTDQVRGVEREGPYQCTAERDPILKAPDYDPDTGFGWDTGFVYVEGPHTGDLYPLNQDDGDGQTAVSDDLLMGGLLLTTVGVVGGSIRSLARMTGVNPEIVRRARRLRDSAALVSEDHRLAVEAVREAWTSNQALESPEVLSALRVLVETGRMGCKVAAAAGSLAARLEPLLTDAAPAAGRRQGFAASRDERLRAEAAVAELRVVLHETETRGMAEQFAQTSVDLLRGPDNDLAGLSTHADFASRPAEYRSVLTDVVGPVLPPAEPPAQDMSGGSAGSSVPAS